MFHLAYALSRDLKRHQGMRKSKVYYISYMMHKQTAPMVLFLYRTLQPHQQLISTPEASGKNLCKSPYESQYATTVDPKKQPHASRISPLHCFNNHPIKDRPHVLIMLVDLFHPQVLELFRFHFVVDHSRSSQSHPYKHHPHQHEIHILSLQYILRTNAENLRAQTTRSEQRLSHSMRGKSGSHSSTGSPPSTLLLEFTEFGSGAKSKRREGGNFDGRHCAIARFEV